MEATQYSFLLKLSMILVALILIIFGFYLTYKKVNSNSGTISFGKLSLKNSTVGVVFMAFGVLILITSIYKGVEMKKTTQKTTQKQKNYDTLGRIQSEVEISTTIVVDSTASVAPVNDTMDSK